MNERGQVAFHSQTATERNFPVNVTMYSMCFELDLKWIFQ